jgi:UDP-2-acetamido-3-amino-2,3-dideoxy-glucuronate N-acetyltransferase
MGKRVVVIGCGHWGRNLVRSFASLGALAGVSDVRLASAKALAEQHGVPARAVEEVWTDADVDAVAIATPAAQHHDLTMKALRAEKHVFVEKPLALDVAAAQEACAVAAEARRTLMVGHLLQYHPAFLQLQALVDAGEVGRLQYVYSNRLNFGRIRREEDILWSFAPHDISMILSLARSEPSDVTAVGSSYLHSTIADVTTTHLAFVDGLRAHVFVSWLHPFKEQKLVVVGDRGMLVFDDGQPWEHKLEIYRHRVNWHNGVPEPIRAESEPVPVRALEPLTAECAHFLHCIETGERPRTDGSEGIRVLRVLQAASRSMAGHVPPATQRAIPLAPVQIHQSAVVDAPSEIGEGTRIWHFCHVLSGSVIGKNCTLGQNVVVGPDVHIGDGCSIQNNVSIYKGVTLEDGVFCGPSSVFTNVLYPRARVSRKDEFRPTLLKRGATVGANATILCGHTLGDYCFIAAGAVVTADVPPHALMAGVPARRIGWVSHDGERLGVDLVCPRSGRRYVETAPGVLEESRDG